MASDAELLPERSREARRSANFMVRAYCAHNFMCEHSCIDVNARSATRLGLPRKLWDGCKLTYCLILGILLTRPI